MAKSGRPRVMSEANKKKYCDLIALGYNIYQAAEFIGCSPLTIRREANRNPLFEADWRQAEVRMFVNPLVTLHQASRTDWKAASWLVERVMPGKFGKRRAGWLNEEDQMTQINELVECFFSVIPDAKTRIKAVRRLQMMCDIWTRRLPRERSMDAEYWREYESREESNGNSDSARKSPSPQASPPENAANATEPSDEAKRAEEPSSESVEELESIGDEERHQELGNDADDDLDAPATPEEVDQALDEMEQSSLTRPSLIRSQQSGRWGQIEPESGEEEVDQDEQEGEVGEAPDCTVASTESGEIPPQSAASA